MSKLAPDASQGTESLLSIVDIARHFSLPESTARYYCKRFAPFIPSCGEGRRRRFRQEVIPVIQTILEVMRSSRTASAVEQELSLRYPRNAEGTDAVALVTSPTAPALAQGDELSALQGADMPALALHLLQQQSHALESIGKALQMMLSRQDQLDSLAAQAESAAAENAVLRTEVGKLRQQVYAAEALQQADLEQLRTWMGRIVRNRAPNA